MFNCWILVLLLLCSNNGMRCGDQRDRRDCDRCNDRRDRDCDRREERREERRERCDDDFAQARPFSGFPGQNTCGCENKSE